MKPNKYQMLQKVQTKLGEAKIVGMDFDDREIQGAEPGWKYCILIDGKVQWLTEAKLDSMRKDQ